MAQTELNWRTHPRTTALCAAYVQELRLPVADTAVMEALEPASARLRDTCQQAGAEPAALLAHLIPLSADPVAPRELAATALTKAMGRQRTEQHVPPLAEALRQLDAALAAARPKLAEELTLRLCVIQEQWHARGPGLLVNIARLTDPAVVPLKADVLLVHPLQGGGGDAWILYNRVTLEAVLANPESALPEVVRLGWLLSQLNLDLAALSELIPPARLPRVARLGMLCAALAAAEEVELARADAETAELALAVWQLDAAPLTAADLWGWWETYQAARPTWPAALAALDRLC